MIIYEENLTDSNLVQVEQFGLVLNEENLLTQTITVKSSSSIFNGFIVDQPKLQINNEPTDIVSLRY